ncbi:hypothetical protein BOX15_Mlig007295g1 [Macrostomum lignano]|uniref:ETS domain-containing protein n=2 Tax=Macrostomum lignano TaxID=282301 RepID=A0A267F792_9PLAT|nr:hypothetical protein BOX15_Mlig007295g1 [Macrostomum lignano]
MSQKTTEINAFDFDIMEIDLSELPAGVLPNHEDSFRWQSFVFQGPEQQLCVPEIDNSWLLDFLQERVDKSQLQGDENVQLSSSVAREQCEALGERQYTSGLGVSCDKETKELLDELMEDADGTGRGSATNLPNVPMFEPQQQQQQQQQQQHQRQVLLKENSQRQQLLDEPPSPTTVSSGFESCESLQQFSSAREAEIDEMVDYIKEVIERSSNCKPEEMSSKLKVHEVILTILLNSTYGDKTKDLRRILAFCDENGRETSGECRHFKTLDTETMGLLWKKIKGNKKATYDTFARAMRVRREKSKGYFDYLDTGKRSKKRIYRFGEKTMADMDRMKRTLRQVSEPRECCY